MCVKVTVTLADKWVLHGFFLMEYPIYQDRYSGNGGDKYCVVYEWDLITTAVHQTFIGKRNLIIYMFFSNKFNWGNYQGHSALRKELRAHCKTPARMKKDRLKFLGSKYPDFLKDDREPCMSAKLNKLNQLWNKLKLDRTIVKR